MVFSIGLDIGREGAAVLLKDQCAVFVLHWKQHVKDGRKVYKLTQASMENPKPKNIVDGLIGTWGLAEGIYGALAGYCMFAGGRIYVCAEDMYLGVNPNTTIALAKFGGAIVSRLEPFDPAKEATWVRPGIWRKQVLGMNTKTKRDAAKAETMERMPGLVENLPALLDVLGHKGAEHICDAAGVALYRQQILRD